MREQEHEGGEEKAWCRESGQNKKLWLGLKDGAGRRNRIRMEIQSQGALKELSK